MGDRILRAIARAALALLMRFVAGRREPDLVLEEQGSVYLMRWWVLPRNRWLNVYLHQFASSDESRALHDHPWAFNASWLLCGVYLEHTINRGGIHVARALEAGRFRLRIGAAPHRLELVSPRAWTLFVTGPAYRKWGFHCPHGFVPHDRWTHAGGCGQGDGGRA